MLLISADVASMGRQEFSAPEESDREKRRKATLQVEYSLLGGFLGAGIATSDLPLVVLLIGALVLAVLPYLTNRYWNIVHRKLPVS